MGKKDRLKLDQMLRMLFKLSRPMTLDLINGLFNERFANGEVKAIKYGNTEWITDHFNRMVGDLLVILETTRGEYRYHVEFQTLNDQSMAIRMFQYGLEAALEVAAVSEAKQWQQESGAAPLFEFPRQVVIYLEENEEIGDSVAFRLRLPDETEVSYQVPVIRYWQLSPQDLQLKRMYALLPLQVFNSRKRIRMISEGSLSAEAKRVQLEQQFAILKENVGQTVAVIADLHDGNELPIRDMERLLRVMSSISGYLYRNYGEPYHQTEKDVFILIKSFYDPKLVKMGQEAGREEGRKAGHEEGLKEGKVQVARRLLSLHVDVETVVRATELPAEEVEKLKEE